jgi:RNA chaperone Hfq
VSKGQAEQRAAEALANGSSEPETTVEAIRAGMPGGDQRSTYVEENWTRPRRDRAIRVRLLDGKVLTGTLKAVDRYTVHVIVGGQSRLVFKHAIAYLGDDEGAAGGAP